MKLDDPELVRREYESERGLTLRRTIWEIDVDARVGDVQDLDFADETFDCVLAAWMLYHVPDLDRGLAELARVLRPGGRLVAVTNGATNLSELWSLLGAEKTPQYTFGRENAAESLERHFARVEKRGITGSLTIPTRADAHRYVSATLIQPELADGLPRDVWPLEVSRAHCVLVATKAAA